MVECKLPKADNGYYALKKRGLTDLSRPGAGWCVAADISGLLNCRCADEAKGPRTHHRLAAGCCGLQCVLPV